MVKIIDIPAYNLGDCFICVPKLSDFWTVLLSQKYDLLPDGLLDELGVPLQDFAGGVRRPRHPPVTGLPNVPSSVSSSGGFSSMIDLAHLARDNRILATLKTSTLQQSPAEIQEWLPNRGRLLFRGVSQGAIRPNLEFLGPSIGGSSARQFGVGVYYTENLSVAINYCLGRRAVFIFKDTDIRELDVYSIPSEDYTAFVISHIRYFEQSSLPEGSRSRDIVTGLSVSTMRKWKPPESLPFLRR